MSARNGRNSQSGNLSTPLTPRHTPLRNYEQYVYTTDASDIETAHGVDGPGHEPHTEAEEQAPSLSVPAPGLGQLSAHPTAYGLPPSPPHTSDDNAHEVSRWHDALDKRAVSWTRGQVHSGSSAGEAQIKTGRVLSNRVSQLSSPTSQGQATNSSFDSALLFPELEREPSPYWGPASSSRVNDTVLRVQIPHYRIGTPRFSSSGSAILKTSASTRAAGAKADLPTATFYVEELDQFFPTPPGISHSFTPPRWSSVRLPSGASRTSREYELTSLTPALTPPASPGLFDDRIGDQSTQQSHDPTSVRYSQGRMIAATPARLVAHITAADFLDYDLLSDFFLSYRSFLSPHDLVQCLFSRMGWAVNCNNDTGRVVRVRTFVALRHWILNYFMDDFEPDTTLRTLFARLVDRLLTEIQTRSGENNGDLQVVGELKKCWTRTCAMAGIPDAEAFDFGFGEDIDMGAGVQPIGLGISTSPRRSLVTAETAGHPLVRKSTVPPSLMSEDSIQVTSCAIPVSKRLRPALNLGKDRRFVADYPVKRQKPSLNHKRSGSFLDALRPHNTRGPIPSNAAPTEQVEEEDVRLLGDELILGFRVRPGLPNVGKFACLSPLSPNNQLGSGDSAIALNWLPELHNVKDLVGNVYRAIRHEAKTSSASGRSDARPRSPRKAGTYPKITGSAVHVLPCGDKSDVHLDLLADLAAEAYEESFAPRTMQSGLSDGPVITSNDEVFTPAIGPRNSLATLRRHSSIGNRSVVIMEGTDVTQGGVNGDYDIALVSDDRPTHQQLEDRASTHSIASTLRGTSPADSHPFDLAGAGRESWDHDQQSNLDGVMLRGSTLHRLSSNVDMTHIGHQLRRRPGGNLRDAGNVQDLGPGMRRASTGSVSTTFTISASASRNTSNVQVASVLGRSRLVSVHAAGGFGSNTQRVSLRLLSTHSSQPILRPSLEAEVARLAEMPLDDEDGDVQSTLMKLEGRYARSPQPLSPPARTRGLSVDRPSADVRVSNHAVRAERDASEASFVGSDSRPNAREASAQNILYSPAAAQSEHDRISRQTMTAEPTSDSGNTKTRPNLHISKKFGRSRFQMPSLQHPKPTRQTWGISDSRGFVQKETIYSHAHSRSEPIASFDPHSSFLLDEDETLSDMDEREHESAAFSKRASTMSSSALAARSFFLDDERSDVNEGADVVDAAEHSSPLFSARSVAEISHEPMPEKAATRLLTPRPQPALPLREAFSFPDMRPSASGNHIPEGSDYNHRNVTYSGAPAAGLSPMVPSSIPHTPFVLAYTAVDLATQFSLIERSALSTITWQELISQAWTSTPPPIHSWSAYLAAHASPSVKPSSGVDLVIARFNLVVKWAVSSIVLTSDISTRALCIARFIHVASHARRLRNFATTYQLTIALLSSDVARLIGTWTKVSVEDRKEFARLEALVQPFRNFRHLRLEMERLSVGAGEAGAAAGCIPFLGVYTRDLAANAQKAAWVDAEAADISRGVAPQRLVNFERFQTGARIVKGVLRLLDSSTALDVGAPQMELLGRCLWLAALGDEEIAARSRALM